MMRRASGVDEVPEEEMQASGPSRMVKAIGKREQKVRRRHGERGP
jgi:hypothetical protein